jgi:cyclohexanone monooxygenase
LAEGSGSRSRDAVVVGAGFAGMYALHRLRELGLSVHVYEAGGSVGGTWYWNRYPGARCDVESLEYSYRFSDELQQEWVWTEKYATQAEILRYAEHVADRFDLKRDIQFQTRVVSAHFDDARTEWTVTTETGESVRARYCIMATGCLSVPLEPEFDDRDVFEGELYYTNRWPHEPVDFSGKRVGVVGTGSSGIQAIPEIARSAGELSVFQRTPNYSFPARNGPLADEEQEAVKADYVAHRLRGLVRGGGFGANWAPTLGSAAEVEPETRHRALEERWEQGGLGVLSAFNDALIEPSANEVLADFIRSKIRAVVDDPETAALLSPDNVVGCKRPCLDSGYFETYNRPNVRLVDISDAPIERLTPKGLVTGGVEHPLDVIVLATGFDAMTGALLRMDIRGRGGVRLADKWADGPRTYLGLAVRGFPNLFLITGPGSPSVLSNMIMAIEQHVEWIADCIDHMQRNGHAFIEATQAAEDTWVAGVNALAEATLYTSCNSWYVGANVPGKPRVFMVCLGFPSYIERCKEVVANGYEGFEFGGE